MAECYEYCFVHSLVTPLKIFWANSIFSMHIMGPFKLASLRSATDSVLSAESFLKLKFISTQEGFSSILSASSVA